MQTSSSPFGEQTSPTLAEALRGLNEIAAALGWDVDSGLQLVSGRRLAGRHHPDIDPARPAIVRLEGADRGAIVRVLGNQYPPDQALGCLDAKGALIEGPRTLDALRADWSAEADARAETVTGTKAQTRTQAETKAKTKTAAGTKTDAQGAEPAFLALAPLAFPGSMLDLAEVIAHLRAPEGCPWDREQTHRSLRPYLLEEAYEAVDAIDAGDLPQLADELGDVLLQVVLHAQIAVEEGSFSLPRVIQAITEKLVRRHPHVFGEVEAETSDAVIRNWEALKQKERDAEGVPSSPYSGIPKAMPSLARAQAVRRKAERLAQIRSDASETGRESRAEIGTAAGTEAGIEEGLRAISRQALGQALFELVGRAEASGLDAETVLREEVARFVREAEARSPAEEGA